MSKYWILLSFYSDLNKFDNLNPQKESKKKKKQKKKTVKKEKSDYVW